MDGDVPEPDAGSALVGEADSADALPAFEDGIVANAVSSELQHIQERPVVADVDGCRVTPRDSTPNVAAPASPPPLGLFL